jgi:hypothetical protein
MNILFDKSLKGDFMRAQKLEVDESGFVVDGTTQKRIKDSKNKLVKATQFGGIRKGSRIFLAENIDTVMEEAALGNKAA